MSRLGFAVLACLWAGPACARTLDLTVHPSDKPVEETQTQAEDKVRRIPGAAAIADRQDWTDRNAATIKDVTEYTPGVSVQPRDGTESFRLSIRGSGLANTFQGRGLLILQDGVPINMADGEFEFPVIDPWLIDYAEILPGANALEEGASTLGGAIDFITPTGRTSPGIALRTAAGSFDTEHGLASAGRAWNTGDAFAAASGYHSQGFRDHNEQKTGRFNGSFGWQPTPQLATRFIVSQTDSRPEIPGAVFKRVAENDPTQANPNNVAGDYKRDLDITRLASRSVWKDGPDQADATVYYTYRTLDNPVTTYIDEDNNDYGGRFKFTHAYGLSKATGGFNFGYGTQDETRYRNVRGRRGARLLDRDLDAVTSEAYGQVEQHLQGGLYGIASLQGAADTRNIEQSTPVSAAQDKTYTGINPRLGLRYDLDAATQLFTNLSRSFEPPTWSELSGGNAPGFHDLDAQTATTFEAGSRGTLKTLNWSAAVYRSWLRDEFVNYQFADGATDTINLDRSIHEGLELGLNGTALRRVFTADDAVEIRGAYTLSSFHLDDDPLYGNNRLPGAPVHFFRGEILYRHPDGWSVGPNVEAASAAPVDITNTLSSSAYAVLGARAAWAPPGHNVSFWVEGRNLLDADYAATTNVIPNARGTDSRSFYPGDGLGVFTGLTIRF